MLLTTVIFNFGRKKTENLSFKNGHFSTICGHFFGNYIDIFHKTEYQMVLLLKKKWNSNFIKIFGCIVKYHKLTLCGTAEATATKRTRARITLMVTKSRKLIYLTIVSFYYTIYEASYLYIEMSSSSHMF